MAVHGCGMAEKLKYVKSVMTNVKPKGHGKGSSFHEKERKMRPDNEYDEVLPRLYVGDRNLACNIPELKSIGITHILNAAKGIKFTQIDTNADYYKADNITFFGIEAVDNADFKIDQYFTTAAEFIAQALESSESKIYVHCRHGRSRSAALVLAYMMLKEDTPLLEAIVILRKKRLIQPKDSFLRQLIPLDEELFPKYIETAAGEHGLGNDTGDCGGKSGLISDAEVTEHGLTYEVLNSTAVEASSKHGKSQGIIYIQCHQGYSRSASVTMAFLMLKRGMKLEEAVKTVRSKRAVMPNDGFIRQLILLNDKIFKKGC